MNMTWWELSNGETKKVPRWMRTVGRTDEGVIYVPAVITGCPEGAVFLCASFDGIPTGFMKKHLYVPLDWAQREYPNSGINYDRIREQVQGFPGAVA